MLDKKREATDFEWPLRAHSALTLLSMAMDTRVMLNDEALKTPAGWSVRTNKNRTDSATRALLVKAARQVFERRGYARTTIAGITSAANVSRATFYVYFASKAEVFTVLALDIRDRFIEAQELRDVDLNNPLEVARASTEAFLDVFGENLLFLAALEQQANVNEEIAQLHEEMTRRPARRTARYIEKLQAQGLVDPATAPIDVANAMLGMIAWYAKPLLHDPSKHDEYVDSLTRMYLRLLNMPLA